MGTTTRRPRSSVRLTSSATNSPSSSVHPAPAAATPATRPRRSMLTDAWEYQVDFWQRSLLFLDTLRERGDNMLAHEEAGLPPLLNCF